MHKKILTVGATLAMSSTPAFAEGFDLNLGGEPGDWSGPYVGVNLDFAHSEGSSDFDGDRFAGRDWDITAGSVEAGFNVQHGAMVFGADGQFSIGGDRNSHSDFYVADSGYDANEQSETELEWFGAVRGRVGLAASPNLLVYGAGGVAFGQVNSTYIYDEGYSDWTIYHEQGQNEEFALGWTLGVGAQWALNQNWSVKAEYSRVDLADTETDVVIEYNEWDWESEGDVSPVETSNEFDVVRIGVSYRY